MGGKGPGHKSRRAWEARQQNIRKARAARKREPLPWRSGLESRVIEQLIWQWWVSTEPRKWPAYRVARFLGVSTFSDRGVAADACVLCPWECVWLDRTTAQRLN